MLVRTRRFSLPSSEALSTIQREMDHLFGRMLKSSPEVANGHSDWHASVAMWDDADKVYFDIELPGVDKENIDVTVHNGMLRISGERKPPEGERRYWVNDRVYGAFNRTVMLPDDVDAETIDAQLTNGVLHIVLSKRPEAQPKKITVKD
jgi:HSP20 family protein